MRRWVAEGRVTGDSWVWREGWTDWRAAGDILPMPAGTTAALPKVEPAPGVDATTIELDDDLSAIRTEGRTVRPRRSMTKTLAVVAALGVVSIVLLGGLIQVILSSNP
jgi:hypothetical protein